MRLIEMRVLYWNETQFDAKCDFLSNAETLVSSAEVFVVFYTLVQLFFFPS